MTKMVAFPLSALALLLSLSAFAKGNSEVRFDELMEGHEDMMVYSDTEAPYRVVISRSVGAIMIYQGSQLVEEVKFMLDSDSDVKDSAFFKILEAKSSQVVKVEYLD